jgi:chromosome segregation ATPase
MKDETRETQIRDIKGLIKNLHLRITQLESRYKNCVTKHESANKNLKILKEKIRESPVLTIEEIKNLLKLISNNRHVISNTNIEKATVLSNIDMSKLEIVAFERELNRLTNEAEEEKCKVLNFPRSSE